MQAVCNRLADVEQPLEQARIERGLVKGRPLGQDVFEPPARFTGPHGSRDVAVKTMNTGTMREEDFIEEALIMMFVSN